MIEEFLNYLFAKFSSGSFTIINALNQRIVAQGSISNEIVIIMFKLIEFAKYTHKSYKSKISTFNLISRYMVNSNIPDEINIIIRHRMSRLHDC